MTISLPLWLVITVLVLAVLWWGGRAVLFWLFRNGPP